MGVTAQGDHKIRFEAPMTYPINCSGTNITLLTLLRAGRCDLRFDAELVVEDLNIPDTYYEMHLIRGLFSALGDNGVEEESCDPWSTHLTYLKTDNTYEVELTGTFESI